jgi:hypothetical protein
MNELGVVVWRIFLHQRTNIRWLMFFFFLFKLFKLRISKAPFGILLKKSTLEFRRKIPYQNIFMHSCILIE